MSLDTPAQVMHITIEGDRTSSNGGNSLHHGVEVYVSSTSDYTSGAVLCGIMDPEVTSDSAGSPVDVQCPVGTVGRHITLVDAVMDMPAESYMLKICNIEVWGSIGLALPPPPPPTPFNSNLQMPQQPNLLLAPTCRSLTQSAIAHTSYFDRLFAMPGWDIHEHSRRFRVHQLPAIHLCCRGFHRMCWLRAWGIFR
jgi:hypothetical protein